MAFECKTEEGDADMGLSRRSFLAAGALGAGLCARAAWATDPSPRRRRPNIVYILADDMGYGDVSCLNPESRIQTTHLDRLAGGGMRFLDAHSPSAVCTPTRYSILTGRYPWRSPLKEGVLWGYSPPLIPPDRKTVPSLLKAQGYHSACIGKWHLGLDWGVREEGQEPSDDTVDFSKPVGGGPRSIGFDYSYIMPSSLDIPPYVYIENEDCEVLPTDTYPGAEGLAFMRPGPCPPGFDPRTVMPRLTEKAVDYIGERAVEDAPFFLYLPLFAPHTPIVPNDAFKGRSGIGDYGDFVLEVDDFTGQVMDALEAHGLTGDTLVIFTSDNGCSPMADFRALASHGHAPSHVFRGHKADIFEGGHRIPFLAHWPGVIPAGSESPETVCLTDLMATAAAIVGAELPANAAEDSVSTLPALRGETLQEPLREATVQASINGSLCIRQGKWKLLFCPGSGGWSDPRPEVARAGELPPVQLYDLEADIAETTNVWDEHPQVVARLTALLEKYVSEGRSTPGPPQQNDGKTSIWGPLGKPPGA